MQSSEHAQLTVARSDLLLIAETVSGVFIRSRPMMAVVRATLVLCHGFHLLQGKPTGECATHLLCTAKRGFFCGD
jgi:hypothetical protein